jgi:hypothetical protein
MPNLVVAVIAPVVELIAIPFHQEGGVLSPLSQRCAIPGATVLTLQDNFLAFADTSYTTRTH